MPNLNSTPDFVTLSRLLKQLDIIDVKRMSAARQKFEVQAASKVEASNASNPNLSPLKFNIDHALRSENNDKNRYSDIVSYDEALLPSPYLNASFIPFPASQPSLPSYISTQAPLPSTFPAFFNHVLSQKVSLVLMLTPLVESGRRKAQQYWPDQRNQKMDLGQGWSIELIQESKEIIEKMDWECFFRRLKVYDESVGLGKGYEFNMVHVTSWADHGSSSKESLKRILDLMDQYSFTNLSQDSIGNGHSNGLTSNGNIEKKPPPILIHCSAGVGRSGTVISSHIVRNLFKYGINPSVMNHSIDSFLKNRNGRDLAEGVEDPSMKIYQKLPYDIVRYVRFFRPRMVQTPDQFEMIWDCWKEQEEKGIGNTK